MSKKISAEEMLNDIFGIMERLYNEMRSTENHRSDHLKVFEIFSELGRTLVEADRASFWRWDKRAHLLVTTAATGTSQIVISDKTGLVGQALAENRAIITNDPYNHPNFNADVDKQTGYVTKSVLVMPVSNCRGEIIGAFQVINKLGSDKGFDEIEDTKRLSIAAFICGMALESDISLADSQRDKLTELKNRFGFHSDYQTRYRQNPSLAIVICDIDFFKKVNDTYGHNAGDAVLVHVAKILSSKGNAYRWGGEEFILILEDATVTEAANLAESIRLAVEDSVCTFEDMAIRVTMSFGCAAVDSALSIEENIKVADARLYRAKEKGRNRVIATD